MSQVIRPLRSVLLTAGAVLGAVCALAVAASLVFGVSALNVISGSMAPGIPTGSMVFAKNVPAPEIRRGDVVTVERRSSGNDIDGLVTHRVVEVLLPEERSDEAADENRPQDTLGENGRWLVLKGDANALPDSDPYVVEEASRYLLHVPFLGNVSLFLQTPFGLSILLVCAALLAFMFFLPAEARARSTGARGASEQSAPTGGDYGADDEAHRGHAPAAPPQKISSQPTDPDNRTPGS
ncbi:signal peptidase I [Leucobacter luti]|uniref:signal peptidase I n=1 Tax=Leucobacter luti TaxID=340320 RepID=UPI001C6902DB|nr:signal peptidase I [Leucobacter luti]QYM75623.1 signal peptidase I [Leucobacter luti]